MRKLLLGSLLSMVACQKAPPPPAPAASASIAPPSPSAAASTAPRSGPHALALAEAQGNAPVDLLLRQTQAALEKRKLDPTSDFWTILGRAWIRKARETQDPGYFQHAGAAAAIILQADPTSVLGLGLRAQVELNSHDFRGAKGTAQTILARRDDDLVALGVLSDAELELGNVEDAEKAAERMMSLKPNLASYVRASYLKWIRGDARAAKEAMRLAIDSGGASTDPEPLAWTLVQAATLFWHQADLPGADAGFTRALATFPDFPPALVGRGRVALARGEAKIAASYLDKAYRLSPLAETAWLLADAHTMAGDETAAKTAIAELEKRGKQSDPRTLGLFWATRKERVDEALALLTDEKKQRADLATLDAYAWALHRAGKDKEALLESDRALRFGTREATLLFHNAAIKLALGKTVEGKKRLQEALKLKFCLDPRSAKEAEELSGEKP